MASAEALQLTREEIIAEIDGKARSRLGMSAAELLRAYRAGTLEDSGEVADLLILADLLPDGGDFSRGA